VFIFHFGAQLFPRSIEATESAVAQQVDEFGAGNVVLDSLGEQRVLRSLVGDHASGRLALEEHAVHLLDEQAHATLERLA
jgi:hypothetical protein